MTSTANDTLNLLNTCVHCGQTIRVVILNDWVGWTHDASGFYTCNLNTHHMSGKPWREYVADPESKLAQAPQGSMSTDCGNGGYPGCCYNAMKDECVNPECECHTHQSWSEYEKQESARMAQSRHEEGSV